MVDPSELHAVMTLSGIDGGMIRAARMSLGWTLDDFATATGISRVTLSQLETGRKNYLFGKTEAAILAALAKAGVRFYRSDSAVWMERATA